jgi:4-hydroxy-3-polyprenylbenzoate decarboxylase
MAAAMGRSSLDDAGDEIFSLVESLSQARGLSGKLSRLPGMMRLLTLSPRRKRGRGECQEVIEKTPDLGMLPILKCWPHDGGRFITLPLVHTRHPETGRPTLGMYRRQVMGRDLSGMHWHRPKPVHSILSMEEEEEDACTVPRRLPRLYLFSHGAASRRD